MGLQSQIPSPVAGGDAPYRALSRSAARRPTRAGHVGLVKRLFDRQLLVHAACCRVPGDPSHAVHQLPPEADRQVGVIAVANALRSGVTLLEMRLIALRRPGRFCGQVPQGRGPPPHVNPRDHMTRTHATT
eukprot:scaffold17733_cov91-Phaeocystis_antarctica.AAC.2